MHIKLSTLIAVKCANRSSMDEGAYFKPAPP